MSTRGWGYFRTLGSLQQIFCGDFVNLQHPLYVLQRLRTPVLQLLGMPRQATYARCSVMLLGANVFTRASGANVFTRADAVHRRLGAGAACGHCQRHGDDGDAQGRPAELSGAGAAGSSLPFLPWTHRRSNQVWVGQICLAWLGVAKPSTQCQQQ